MLSFHWGTADGVEDINRYAPGGFHPVHLGNTFRSDKASYRVLNKLGYGSFSTVWLARIVNDSHESSSGRYVALKICVADADPRHELAVYARLPHTNRNHVIQLLDSFSLRGPNGTHLVLVHDVLGSLRDTIPPALAPKQVRQLCRQIVQGVSFLHSHGVVHGDLHAGNIGICLPTLDEHSEDDILDYFGHPEIHLVLPCQPHARPESLPLYQVPSIELGYYYKQKDASFTKSPLCVEIMDLGNAALAGEDPRPSCTAPAVCAPEIMFNLVTSSVNSPSTFESDIWSLACTLYEIVRGSSLFHWARPNDALLEKMAKLCGEMLPEWREHIPDMANTISAEGADAEWEMLVSHPTKDRTTADVAEFVALLRWMMKMDPQARPNAEEVASRSILDNAHSSSPSCDMKVNPLFFVPFFIACVHVSALLIPVPNQAFLKLVSQKWADNVRWKHEASFQLQYDWNDLTSIPSDFWERAMNLGDRVRKYAEDRLNDYSNTPFAGRIEQFKVTVDETIAYTARMKDEMRSTYGVNLEAFTIDLEKLLQTLQKDMEVAFPPPGEAPHHEQRAHRVSAALMKLEEGIVHLGAKYGMPEEQMKMHLDNLRPHIEHLLVMTGDLAEQHPVLLEVLLFSASIMIIPESWFLRPFLGAFGFGPYGPVKGSAAAWAQRTFFGAAVKPGSWFAHLQSAGMRRVILPIAPKIGGLLGWLTGSLGATMATCW